MTTVNKRARALCGDLVDFAETAFAVVGVADKRGLTCSYSFQFQIFSVVARSDKIYTIYATIQFTGHRNNAISMSYNKKEL